MNRQERKQRALFRQMRIAENEERYERNLPPLAVPEADKAPVGKRTVVTLALLALAGYIYQGYDAATIEEVRSLTSEYIRAGIAAISGLVGE